MGIGVAGGAGTIVNAMATGKGAAFGLSFRVRAECRPATRWGVFAHGRRVLRPDDMLALESARAVQRSARRERPLRIDVASDIPPERGLKSSSAVSVAVIRATLDEIGERWTDGRVLDAAADAGLASKTSLTGAFDDAAACLLGGVVVTDNANRRIVKRSELPSGLTALVHVPRQRLPTAAVRGTDFTKVEPLVDVAWQLAARGDARHAMLLNSAAYAPLFGHSTDFTIRALGAGAWSAGLSGKGPAQIALVDARHAARVARALPSTRRITIRRGGAR